MAQWPLPPDLHSRTEAGPLCPFSDHSLGSRDGRIARYDDSHACVRCVSALTEGRLTLDVHKIHRNHRRRFLEFWSFVEINEPDECWPWRGKQHSKTHSTYFSIPRFWGSARQYSAQRAAFWYSWGDVGRLPIKAVCGNNQCCNPLHLKAKGVPHFHHNRHMSKIDLEYNSNKLEHDTLLFLEATKEKDSRRFEKIQKTNKLWIDFRMSSDKPVQIEDLIKAAMTEEDRP